MSTILDPYVPASALNLNFASSQLAKAVRQLSSGSEHYSLLLHGPSGTGKTTLARLIVATRYPLLSPYIRDYIEHHGSGWVRKRTIEAIDNWTNTEMAGGIDQHFAIINEIDQLSTKDLNDLMGHLDNRPNLQILATTNHYDALPKALKNRVTAIPMAMPTVEDLASLVETVVTNRGFQISSDQSLQVAQSAKASWRDLARAIERQL